MKALNKFMGALLALAVFLGLSIAALPLLLREGEESVVKTINIGLVETPGYEKPASSYERIIEKISSSLDFFVRTSAIRFGLFSVYPVQTAPMESATLTYDVAPSQVKREYSATNIQVEGVDEHDVVKTDGRYIYVLRGGEVAVFDSESMKVVSRIKLPEGSGYSYLGSGIYVAEKRLVILATKQAAYRAPELTYARITPYYSIGEAMVAVVDVSNAHEPLVVDKIAIDGDLKSSRLAGKHLYVITLMPCFRVENGEYVPAIPRINGEYVPPSSIVVSDEPARYYTLLVSIDLETGSRSSLAVLQNSVDWVYMAQNRLYLAEKLDNYLELLFYNKSIEVFVNSSLKLNILPSSTRNSVLHLVSQGEYVDAFEEIKKYLASVGDGEIQGFLDRVNQVTPALSTVTKFTIVEVNGTTSVFRGCVEVEGDILDQFAMEEFQRGGETYFITATTVSEFKYKFAFNKVYAEPPVKPGGGEGYVEIEVCDRSSCQIVRVQRPTPPPSSTASGPVIHIYPFIERSTSDNRVYVVDPVDLGIVGVLRDIAREERIYSARLWNDVFYLVTFRNVDPLFAINISNPRSPFIIGYLKIPGFSEYLHPVASRFLLGVGLDNGYIKISLFNVENPLNMSELSTIKLPASTPLLWDHHAFAYDARYNTGYVPVAVYGRDFAESGVLVFKVDLDENRLEYVELLYHENAVRAVYIGHRLYTISTSTIKAWSIPGLNQIGEASLD